MVIVKTEFMFALFVFVNKICSSKDDDWLRLFVIPAGEVNASGGRLWR